MREYCSGQWRQVERFNDGLILEWVATGECIQVSTYPLDHPETVPSLDAYKEIGWDIFPDKQSAIADYIAWEMGLDEDVD